MNYNQALMVIRNATSGYTADKIKEAAVYVLGTIDATEEDVWDANSALGYADQMHVKADIPRNARCSDLDDHPFSSKTSFEDH